MKEYSNEIVHTVHIRYFFSFFPDVFQCKQPRRVVPRHPQRPHQHVQQQHQHSGGQDRLHRRAFRRVPRPGQRSVPRGIQRHGRGSSDCLRPQTQAGQRVLGRNCQLARWKLGRRHQLRNCQLIRLIDGINYCEDMWKVYSSFLKIAQCTVPEYTYVLKYCNLKAPFIILRIISWYKYKKK